MASGSSGNAYRVSDGTTALLLDAGIPYKAIQAGLSFCMHELSGCLITHAHQDHCKAARDLTRRGIDVYASRGTLDACSLTGHRAHVLTALKQLDIGTFKVLAFDVEHDAPEPLGFLLESTASGEKLLYVTDTQYVKYRFKGLTHMMVECNYTEDALRRAIRNGSTGIQRVPRLVRSHMSLETLHQLLMANDKSKLQQVYLLHMSSDNGDADSAKKAVQQLTGAQVIVC